MLRFSSQVVDMEWDYEKWRSSLFRDGEVDMEPLL